MGAYLDKPVVDKVSDFCQLDDGLSYGYSTMQGWRTSQEDAHLCAVNFDADNEGRHMFGVFDGHGGSEVSRYVSEQLVDFLLSTAAYQSGDFKQALRDTFLGMDAKLLQPEVAKILRAYSKADSDDEDEDEDGVAKEAQALHEDAKMPLKNLLKTFGAPLLRAAAAGAMSAQGDSEEDDEEEEEEDEGNDGEEAEDGEGESTTEKSEKVTEKSEEEAVDAGATSSKAAADEDGAAAAPVAGSSRNATAKMENENNQNIEKELSNQNGQSAQPSEADEEEEDDTDYKPGDEVPVDNNAGEGEEEEEEDGEEDEEDDDDDDSEESESEEDYEVIMPSGDDPGVDSGTTAVVALLVGKKLYVANAGDSRAVLSEAGVARDLSIDHKPEDKPERERIEAAGGHVTKDGRINGGLNLSRALGDHAYKQSQTLSAPKQIVSPEPDIMIADIDDRHRFLLLACDGIWNSMTSQEAIDFCEKRLAAGLEPHQICEALFDHCLAPDTTDVEGNGCDNMTAVLVRLGSAAAAAARKRPAVDNNGNGCEQANDDDANAEAKRPKVDA